MKPCLNEIKFALKEDIGEGDVTAALLSESLCKTAVIISREPMLVCGTQWVDEVFKQVCPSIVVEWFVKDGDFLEEPTTLCEIRGLARGILTAERTAINFLQTLSGTATVTYRYLQKLKGYSTRLLDTRKTIPGLRRAQKYAVACAGGTNHRMGLYDAYLIKENHIVASGSISKAIELAKHKNLFIEVEVTNLDELREALAAKPDRIMLDNFSLSLIEAAVLIAKPYKIPLEVSGGVNLATIKSIAKTGVDFVSVGEITKSLHAIDLSLLVKK